MHQVTTAQLGGGREAVFGCHIAHIHICLTRDTKFIAVPGTSLQKQKTSSDLDFLYLLNWFLQFS